MRYENNTVKSERVRELLERAGISIGEFSKSLWGAKTHNTIHTLMLDQMSKCQH